MSADTEVTQPDVAFAYQPALDGVRGLAVMMVLLFHAGFGWMSGGYLGVSVFFTLSGYLITSLALREHDTTARLGIGAFYVRRIRRLLPASLLCVLGVSVLAAFGLFEGVVDLRRDLWAALAQVYNWAALAGGGSYEEVVSAAAGTLSPLEHYWSLSIEEQFYWVWPVLLAVLLTLVAARRTRMTIIFGATVLAGAVAPLVAGVWGARAAYWATSARLGEILVGAALAAAVADDRMRRILQHRSIIIVGLVSLGAIVVSAATWPADGGPAYSGWLPVFALASAALIAGLQVESPLRRALSTRPLVVLGAISYGVYLYHWPVYTLIHPGRIDLPRVPLFAVRLIVTLVIAAVSYIAIERPIRHGRGLPFGRVGGTALAGCAVMALVVAVVVPARRGSYWDVSEAEQAAMRADVELRPVAGTPPPLRALGANGTGSTVATSVDLNRPLRVLVFGDSTASAVGVGLTAWAVDHPVTLTVEVRWAPGCDLLRLGEMVDGLGQYEDDCVHLHAQLPRLIRRLRPDVLVVMTTTNEVADRRLDGDGDFSGPGDPAFDRAVQARYLEFLDGVREAGVDEVAWVKPPVPAPYSTTPSDDTMSRFAWLWDVEQAVAAERPELVRVVDLPGWAERQAEPVRPDGLHVSPEAGYRFAAELVPMLVEEVLS